MKKQNKKEVIATDGHGVVFSVKDVEKRIKKDIRYIERMKGKIDAARACIKATNDALAYWQYELNKITNSIR